MLGWLKKRAASSRVLGLDMYEDGVAMAVIDRSSADRPLVTASRWCAFDPAGDRAAALKRAVRELGARGLPAVATLPHAAYSLVQLEAPELATEELREAMRWRVKELIDFPVEEAVIDVVKLPPSRRPGSPELVYVVVARQNEVEQLGGLLDQAGLVVEAIDIVEMAIRNLAMYLDRPDRPRAYLHMDSGQTVIEIVDGPELYLSRRVPQEYDADADTALLHAQMENLALEVQRSLDYFESQYALGPADQLSVIVGDQRLFVALQNAAQSFLTVQVQRFDFAGIQRAKGVELETLGRGATAVGSAMRGLPWAA
ncbi:MAG: pilus assembly protein PilM [Chromatiaceae bacterium]